MYEVFFVGCGPGDPDLITVKAADLIRRADVMVYSGSLIPSAISDMCSGTKHDASGMVRQEITDVLRSAAQDGKTTIRLHDGDPTIYGAIREQMDQLEKDGIRCTIIPGVTAMLASAAALGAQLTLPGVTQTIIITRVESRTEVPKVESISSLAQHQATMVLYLSVHLLKKIVQQAIDGGYESKTPVAVVYRASQKDQMIIVGTLNDIEKKVRKERITRTAMVIIGDVIKPRQYEYSKLYDASFSHMYRRANVKQSE